MSEQIQAKRVSRPDGESAPIIDLDEGGADAQQAFTPFEEEILATVHEKIQAEFNDPDIFFLDEEDGFPLRAQASGEYYLGGRSYQSEDGEHTLFIMLNCLDHGGGDYVGLEMIIYLSSEQPDLEFEEHFQSSAI